MTWGLGSSLVALTLSFQEVLRNNDFKCICQKREVDVCGPGCHQRPHGCPGSRLKPVAMLGSKGRATTGTWLSEWSVLPPGALVSSRPGLLPRAVSGPMGIIQQLGSELMSATPATKKAARMPEIWSATRDHVGVWEPCCHQVRADPGVLCCTRVIVMSSPSCCWRLCLGPWYFCSWVCVDVHGPCYHRGP